MTQEQPSRTLGRLARSAGIQTSYVDMAGRRQDASAASLKAVLNGLGIVVSNADEIRQALGAIEAERGRDWLGPIRLVWMPGTTELKVRTPILGRNQFWQVTWQLESGELARVELRAVVGSERADRAKGGRVFQELRIPVPSQLSAGYHRLICEGGSERTECRIIAAPERCYQPAPDCREWGGFAPLYAMRSARNWGVGDLTDLQEFMAWVGERGGALAGTLPLLPAFLRTPCEFSPYSPVSRLGWNEVFLDVERVPELEGCRAAQRWMVSRGFSERLQRLRRGRLVDYQEVMRLKREVLERLCRSFFQKASPRRAAFDRFCRARPRVGEYARFRAVGERRGVHWQTWPERMRRGELRAGDGLAAVERYHAYVQWLADEQLRRVARAGAERGVALYLDMPLGTHRDGYDAWREQDLFALGASGGAPPDPVFTKGQDWGFAPIHPEQSRRTGHVYLVEHLRHHLQLAGMLRFDHVMGLHRLYWVPAGHSAAEGAYVRYPAEETYALLSVESHRHQAVIVGEDLGTVPPEVNRAMKRHGVFGMFVDQYEFRAPPRRPLRPVPEDVVVSVNTHDMPPFQAWCEGLDLADRVALGLMTERQAARERRVRQGIIRELRKRLPKASTVGEDPNQVGNVLRCLLRHDAMSRAKFQLINLEDLWLERHPQNVPGTATERVNWRRKLRHGLRALGRDARVKAQLAVVDQERRKARAGKNRLS